MSDTAVAAHFGSDAVAVKGRQALVWVVGEDAVSFLDGLLSQNISGMAPGTVAPSLLLAPNGKMRATLTLLRGNGRVGLVCDTRATTTIVEDLSRFKIRVDATISTEERELWEVWSDPGERSDSRRWAEDGGVLRFDLPLARSALRRSGVVGEVPGVAEVSATAIEPLRIEAGEPVMGVDLTDKTIPQEGVVVEDTVDFTKGCYLGQELVARIDSRGHVNRKLAGVIFDQPVEPGMEVIADSNTVGAVTSAAFSGPRSATVALAMIRVEVAAGASVAAGRSIGTVTDLPITF